MAKKQKYPLPPPPSSISATFAQLCMGYSADEVQQLIGLVESADRRFTDAALDYLGPDLSLVKQLLGRSRLLLMDYAGYSPQHQSLIIGAVRYFVLRSDAFPDSTPIVGLDDDVLVMNHVLEELGLVDQFIGGS